ncbi:MAG: SseB family protein [Lachnospiraceae bacterium]|nr:SseB family protein [Lachnospiraceae bacterium]
MYFEPKEIPDNKELKEFLGWRATCVTEAQSKNLIKKLGDQIVMKARFVTYIAASEKPEKVENGVAAFPKGAKILYYTMKNKEGKEFLPLFTSEEELEKWNLPKDGKVVPLLVIMNFDDLTPVFMTNTSLSGACINPMSDNFIMGRQMMSTWTTQKRAMLNAALLKLTKEQGGGEPRGPRPVK